MTTIHLILTHEVNELFEEMKHARGGEKEEGEDSEERSEYSEEEITPKTPDTREIIKHSKVSSLWKDKLSSQVSARSSLK